MTYNLLFCIRFTFLMLGILSPTFCYGQTSKLINNYSVKKLTEEDGFVSSEIYSIIQDRQGLLWFGTAENGVMRYDGRKVTLFEFDKVSTNGLSHNDAGNLMLDRNGNIWVGTWGGGANRYNPKTGKFENFIHDPLRADSISSNRIQSLFHDHENIFWLGSYDQGLNRYLGNNRFAHITKLTKQPSGLSHNRIWDIEDKDDNNLWLATSFGLNLYNKTTETFTHFFPESKNKTPTGANEIRNILKTSQNTLYIGTQQGPFSFDESNNTFAAITLQNGDLLGQVNSMIEDHQGYIWFVTSNGVFRKSNLDSQIEKLELEDNNGLRIIFEDSSKTIWITSEVKGIFKLVPHRKFKSINNPELTSPNGIATDPNGDILIISSSSQLFKWQVSSQTLETLSDRIFSEKNGFTGNRLLEKPIIFPEGKNTLWIAQDEGLAQLNLKTKQINLITYPKSENNYKEFREIRALNTDRHGTLWIGTYKNGIYLYDPLTKKFSHLDSSFGLSHPEVLGVFKDDKQNIWVGTGNGANLWLEHEQKFMSFKSDDTDPTSLLGNIIQDLHQSRKGDIWIATQKGLNLYIPKTKSFKHFSQQNGLPTSLIRAVEDDKNGHLWITTNKGISKLDPISGKVTNYDSHNGLLGSNYYANSLSRGADETLFTSSQRGIEYFNPLNIDKKNNDFNLVLTGFNKMGQSVKLDAPYSYVSDIQLSYLDYFFSFEFSVLDFISPENSQYAYKLEGYDDNWIDIGNRNIASFTNLDGGSYRFLVKATNSSGKWGVKLLSINLHISPPPWKTWWAYTLYIALIISISFSIIYLRTRMQQTELMRQKQFVLNLEEQVYEKTTSLNIQAQELKTALSHSEKATLLKSEFINNISHEIKAPVNGVLGMLDLLKKSNLTSEQNHNVNIAYYNTNSLLIFINDVLCFSKIESGHLQLNYIDFSLQNLLEKLTHSMALSVQAKDIEIILDMAEINYDSIKSDPVRIQQILTNILNNAIKLTELGEIKISAQLKPTKEENKLLFYCKIQDTGIGIPEQQIPMLFSAFNQVDTPTTTKYTSAKLGLTISKELSKLLGGDVIVSSEIGVGSCFEVTCLVQKSELPGVTSPSIDT